MPQLGGHRICETDSEPSELIFSHDFTTSLSLRAALDFQEEIFISLVVSYEFCLSYLRSPVIQLLQFGQASKVVNKYSSIADCSRVTPPGGNWQNSQWQPQQAILAILAGQGWHLKKYFS